MDKLESLLLDWEVALDTWRHTQKESDARRRDAAWAAYVLERDTKKETEIEGNV